MTFGRPPWLPLATAMTWGGDVPVEWSTGPAACTPRGERTGLDPRHRTWRRRRPALTPSMTCARVQRWWWRVPIAHRVSGSDRVARAVNRSAVRW